MAICLAQVREPAAFVVVSIESHGFANTGQRILQVGIEIRRPLSNGMVIAMDASRERRASEHQHGNGEKSQQGQAPIQSYQHDGDADQGQTRRQHSFEAVDKNPFHVLRIVHDARHHLAGRALFEISHGQSLKRREDLLSQMMNHALFQRVVKSDPQGIEPVFERVRAQQGAQGPRKEIRLTSLDDVIDDDLNQPWGEEIQRCGQRGAGERSEHQTAICGHVGENAEQGLHVVCARAFLTIGMIVWSKEVGIVPHVSRGKAPTLASRSDGMG